mgnify:CR=1 FL=1
MRENLSPIRIFLQNWVLNKLIIKTEVTKWQFVINTRILNSDLITNHFGERNKVAKTNVTISIDRSSVVIEKINQFHNRILSTKRRYLIDFWSNFKKNRSSNWFLFQSPFELCNCVLTYFLLISLDILMVISPKRNTIRFFHNQNSSTHINRFGHCKNHYHHCVFNDKRKKQLDSILFFFLYVLLFSLLHFVHHHQTIVVVFFLKKLFFK